MSLPSPPPETPPPQNPSSVSGDPDPEDIIHPFDYRELQRRGILKFVADGVIKIQTNFLFADMFDIKDIPPEHPQAPEHPDTEWTQLPMGNLKSDATIIYLGFVPDNNLWKAWESSLKTAFEHSNDSQPLQDNSDSEAFLEYLVAHMNLHCDGTNWGNDELIRARTSYETGVDMNYAELLRAHGTERLASMDCSQFGTTDIMVAKFDFLRCVGKQSRHRANQWLVRRLYLRLPGAP